MNYTTATLMCRSGPEYLQYLFRMDRLTAVHIHVVFREVYFHVWTQQAPLSLPALPPCGRLGNRVLPRHISSLSTCCRFFSPVSADTAGICVTVQLDRLQEEGLSAPLGPLSLKAQRSGHVKVTYHDAEPPKLLFFTERSENEAARSH